MSDDSGSSALPATDDAAPAARDVDGMFAQRNRLSRRLVDATRSEDVTSIIVTALDELLGATAGVVLRLCPGREHLHGLWGLGLDQGLAESLELSVTDGPWCGALDEVVTDGVLQVGADDRRTWFVPMGPAGAGWVLAVFEPARSLPGTFGQELACAVADATYIALQRAELVSQLDGKIEILEATAALSASVGLDLDDALVAVAQQAAAALSCERSAVYLIDDDTLTLAHVHDAVEVPGALRQTSDGLLLAAEVVSTGGQVLHQDVTTCELADGPWHQDAGSVAVLGLPLTVAGRTIGALVVAHTVVHPRGFTTLCTQVGGAVAQQAAIALEQARLYEVERQTVRRLRELDRMKADWMTGLTHDLKAPLTGLLGFVETLRRLAGQVTPDQQRDFLAVMSRQAGQLVALVEDLLLSARIDGDAVARRRELIPIGELMNEAADLLDQDKRDALTVDDQALSATVVGDRMHLLRVIQNLLSNAWRHGASRVSMTSLHQGGDVVVLVDDDGPGIPSDERELVFERFHHGEAEGSTGLGLYVARGIVVAHGGSLRVLDHPSGVGARLELRLPHSRRQREEDLDAGSAAPGQERRRRAVDLTV